jgi:hypothetical protein
LLFVGLLLISAARSFYRRGFFVRFRTRTRFGRRVMLFAANYLDRAMR